MRIFDRRGRTEEGEADVRLVQREQKPVYDLWAVLAKTLLIFLLTDGAIGGFLSAYSLDYDKGSCMTFLIVFAFVLCAVYETGWRWLTNLVSILAFLLYLALSLRFFWTINSGYYTILNHVYESAREYLHVSGGTEYVLRVEDSYASITCFVLFVGIVGVILLNIQLYRRPSLWRTALLTLPFYLLPLYFERSPDAVYVFFLLTGYVTVAMVCAGRLREHIAGQLRYLLPAAALAVIVIVRLVQLALPQGRYELLMPDNAAKKQSEHAAANFAQFGLMSLFQRGQNGAGMSGGMLSRGSAVMPDYETHLKVSFTPYSYEPLYLRAFVGKEYTGLRWLPAGDTEPEDLYMTETVKGLRELYQEAPGMQGRGVMKVENVGADENYQYQPYYTAGIRLDGREAVYTYFPYNERMRAADTLLSPEYLNVPDSCADAVSAVCAKQGFSGAPEEIARQVKAFFLENYSYTLRPGFYYGNPDYISHFLLESKKGYCAHFASAATMLFRCMGIPARYVEGYAISYNSILLDGALLEEVSFRDYYEGYSALGETGLIEVEIPDANAHAWVEIYVDGAGWTVVDPTPPATEEERLSFWDAFSGMQGGGEEMNFGGNNIGAYLEGAVNRAAGMAFALAVLLGTALILRSLIRRVREARLSERERVKLEYRRLTARLGKRHGEFAGLRTIREQLDWLAGWYDLGPVEELTGNLYEIFFGTGAGPDCGRVRKKLSRLHRKIYFPKIYFPKILFLKKYFRRNK